MFCTQLTRFRNSKTPSHCLDFAAYNKHWGRGTRNFMAQLPFSVFVPLLRETKYQTKLRKPVTTVLFWYIEIWKVFYECE